MLTVSDVNKCFLLCKNRWGWDDYAELIWPLLKKLLQKQHLRFPCLLNCRVQILTPNNSYYLKNWRSWECTANTWGSKLVQKQDKAVLGQHHKAIQLWLMGDMNGYLGITWNNWYMFCIMCNQKSLNLAVLWGIPNISLPFGLSLNFLVSVPIFRWKNLTKCASLAGVIRSQWERLY